MRIWGVVLLCLLAFPGAAEARHHHRHHSAHHRAVHHRVHRAIEPGAFWFTAQTAVTRSYHAVAEAAAQMLPHPDGCPPVAFCACGAAVEKFGRPVRSLWLAAAWYHFPRSAPVPGAVAVHPHHVFVLREQIRGDLWRVADYNSGGHRSRLHVRSISGWTIVNPS